MPERAIPTTRGSGNPVIFIHDMPDQRQGVGSPSFQSEKAAGSGGWSTADLRERRARPSEERERTEKGEMKKRKRIERKEGKVALAIEMRWRRRMIGRNGTELRE